MRTAALRLGLVVLVIAAAVATDQAAKTLARAHLRTGEASGVIDDVVILIHAENEGAFLSFGYAWPRPVRVAVFSGLSAVVVAAAGAWAAGSARLTWPQALALSLVAGGGAGNLVDRLTRGGRVTDFLNVGIGVVRTGIFNLADVYLLAGIVLLVLSRSKRAGR